MIIIILGLAIVLAIGIVILSKKKDKISKNNNESRPNAPSKTDNKDPSPEQRKLDIIKIKKVGEKLYYFKSYYERDNKSGSSEITIKEENISKIIQEEIEEKGEDNGKKEILINGKQELKDNLGLVKERRTENSKINYYTWYENDREERVVK